MSESSVYYRYQPLPDPEPLLPIPPPSPSWQKRPRDDLNRRPSPSIRLRPTVLIFATVLVAISLLSFYHASRSSLQDDHRLLNDSTEPDHALLDRPQLDYGVHVDHSIPHHPHIPSLTASATSATAHPEQSQASHEPSPPDPITFALIMFSEDSAAEGAILIKSLILYSSSSLAFHIICDQAAQDYIEKRMALLTHPQHDILVRFYRIPHEHMLARIEREGALHTDHSAGVPGLMKLFIHEILPPAVERAIFIDTDAFFIADPAQLWARFAALPPGVAISMPSHPDQYEPAWHHANRICSCIMLLDLARLRALRLMDSAHYRADPQAARVPALAPPAFAAMYGPPVLDEGGGGRYKYADVKLGDQGYWWAIVSHRPELFAHLGYDWEVSSCLMDMYSTGLGDDAVDADTEARAQVHTDDTPEAGRAVLPKMLHFNCLEGVERYYEWPGWADPQNGLAQRWLPAVRFHLGYKWIWLNTPLSNATVTVETLRDVRFADEIFAESRGAAQA